MCYLRVSYDYGMVMATSTVNTSLIDFIKFIFDISMISIISGTKITMESIQDDNPASAMSGSKTDVWLNGQ